MHNEICYYYVIRLIHLFLDRLRMSQSQIVVFPLSWIVSSNFAVICDSTPCILLLKPPKLMVNLSIRLFVVFYL